MQLFQHNTVLSASIIVQPAEYQTWYNVRAFSLLESLALGKDSASVADSGSIPVIFCSYCTAGSHILTTG